MMSSRVTRKSLQFFCLHGHHRHHLAISTIVNCTVNILDEPALHICILLIAVTRSRHAIFLGVWKRVTAIKRMIRNVPTVATPLKGCKAMLLNVYPVSLSTQLSIVSERQTDGSDISPSKKVKRLAVQNTANLPPIHFQGSIPRFRYLTRQDAFRIKFPPMGAVAHISTVSYLELENSAQ